MIYHIVTGDLAAAPLKDAIVIEPSMAGEVVVMKDVLSVGPVRKADGQKFSDMRTEFWQTVFSNEKMPMPVDDLERLLHTGNELSKNDNAKIWLWMAPLPADISMYYWALAYLHKYTGRVWVINIAGLPFLDDAGKIFYPKSIADIQPAQLVKARRLARPVTASETETDVEEWQKMTRENAGIRVHETGKRLSSKSEAFYDDKLISFCSHQYQKASRITSQAISKFLIPTGDMYLGWRLRKIAGTGKLQLQGDATKSLKDFEVKLPE
jgi:hypothetical protein